MTDLIARLRAALADRYRIERELGSGGMATVYLARDLKHERQVAVKVLRPELAAALGPERFHQEIKIAANLNHPHVLPLLDSGDAEGFLYYVMPFVEGESLRDKLAKEGELPIPEAVRILRDVVDALSEAHEKGVVHRDIKPDNVLLTKHHALVTDFGVAKAVSEATGAHKLTTEGVALGTPAYMSPEQAAADKHIDHRADIYAVGTLAYELLTGRTPFTGTTPQQLLSAQLTQTPDPVTKYRESVPPDLEQLVMRCLEKKAADRWQSAEELLPHLEALATPSGGVTPTGTMPVDRLKTRRRNGLRSAVLVAVLLLVGVLLVRYVVVPSLGGRDQLAQATLGELRDSRPSLAVLPFENRSDRPEDKYFTDGIHDELLTRLAAISGLKTIARTSVEEYRDTPKAVREIGRELGVQYIMEGGVQRSGDRVRVIVQLIDAVNEGHVWADTYDRELSATDLLEIQTEITEAVARELRAAISAEERLRIARAATTNLKAYDLYLRAFGSSDPSRTSAENFAAAERLYTEVIREDPDFCLAYLALAGIHTITYQYAIDRSEERVAMARAALDRAQEIDPDLPELQYQLGVFYYRVTKDFGLALEHLRRAEGTLRGDAALARFKGYVERRLGRWEDSERSLELAYTLNPRSVSALHEQGISFQYRRRYDEAEEYFDRALELVPGSLLDLFDRAETYLLRDGNLEPLRAFLARLSDPSQSVGTRWGVEFRSRDWEAALSALERGDLDIAEGQYDVFPRSLLEGWTYSAWGQPRQAREAFQRAVSELTALVAENEADDRYHRALGLAYAGLGNVEAAVREGERALELMPPERDALNGPYSVSAWV